MSRDKLLIARAFSKGNVTSDEAATANNLVIPPGMYDIEIHRGAVTGITGFSLSVQEQGYKLDDPTHTVAGWGALTDPRGWTATVANAVEHAWIRGVRIQRWYDGMDPTTGVARPNAGIAMAHTGTFGSVANVQIVFWPIGRAPQWNGNP